MKSYYRVNHILCFIIQWTWGICQNIPALILMIALHIKNKDTKTFFYHGAFVTKWDHPYSMGLGMFVFLGKHSPLQRYNDMILVHEYGHTIQSCILGPLFLPIIGLPSLLWAGLPYFKNQWFSGNKYYTQFYPEYSASYLGELVLHQPAVWD